LPPPPPPPPLLLLLLFQPGLWRLESWAARCGHGRG
jgi:hypothetical protein